MSTPSSLADACPVCFPGDQPACLPILVHDDGNGGLCAHYACPACGHRWRTGWDPRAAGWPQSREAAA